jgi:cytochrome b subunit of formate dehydrogenase
MLKLAFAIPGAALAAAIVWAIGKADFWTSVVQVTANPWGVVTLVDLYAGFIITGMIIAAIERWRPWAWGMLALALVLGNIVFALWGMVRGAQALRRLAAG